MNPLSWLSRTLRAPQSDEPVAEAPVVGAMTAGEIKEGQLIVRGWVHTAPGAAATVELRFGAHAVAANLIVPEEEEAQPATTQFEARLEVSAVEQLSALQITSSLHDGKDRIPLRVSSLKPDIDKPQLKTKQHFFRNVQLPSTRVKDRQALTRLAQEGIAKFGSDPEVLASGLCVLIYGLLLDRGALSGPVLQYCLETEAHTQKVMAQIQGPKFVRWSSSIFIAYGYLFVRLARFEQAAAAFERVGVLAERLAEWPSIDVDVSAPCTPWASSPTTLADRSKHARTGSGASRRPRRASPSRTSPCTPASARARRHSASRSAAPSAWHTWKSMPAIPPARTWSSPAGRWSPSKPLRSCAGSER